MPMFTLGAFRSSGRISGHAIYSESGRLLVLACVATDNPCHVEDAVLLDFQLDIGIVAVGVVHYPTDSPRPGRLTHRRAEDWEPVPETFQNKIDQLAVGR